jgi:hypothetical protein
MSVVRPEYPENKSNGATASALSEGGTLANAGGRACLSCGESIGEIVKSRPEYCFVCAVHVVCACADEPD